MRSMPYWFYLTQTRSLIPSFTQSECQSSEKLFWCYLNVGKNKMLLWFVFKPVSVPWHPIEGNLDSGIRKDFACEIRNLGLRILNSAQGIWNSTNDLNQESSTWKPESKSGCFVLPLMGRTLNYTIYCNLKMISNHIRDLITLKATYYKRHSFTTKFGVDKIINIVLIPT